ncbi:hypothetical protein EMIT0P43_30205 [Pseudomonas jessenii]
MPRIIFCRLLSQYTRIIMKTHLKPVYFRHSTLLLF